MPSTLPENSKVAVKPVVSSPANSSMSGAAPSVSTSFLSKDRYLLIVLAASVIFLIVVLFFVRGVPGWNPIVVKVGKTEITQADMDSQNQALVGYYNKTKTPLSQKQIEEISHGREVVAQYANANGITVSDSEVAARKAQLIAASSKERIMADNAKYGWTEKDWEQVLWWQILREKILASFQAYRQGEWISLRWDAFSPKLDDATVAAKTPLAKAYMEDLQQKLQKGEVLLKNVYASFDPTKDPAFAKDPKYMMQYNGINPQGEYTKFMVNPQNANASTVSSLKFPGVSEVICDKGACSFYNILSGSNGTAVNPQVQKFLQGEYLI